jgi:hypothetical protein
VEGEVRFGSAGRGDKAVGPAFRQARLRGIIWEGVLEGIGEGVPSYRNLQRGWNTYFGRH